MYICMYACAWGCMCVVCMCVYYNHYPHRTCELIGEKDPHIGHRIIAWNSMLMTFRGLWRVCFENMFLKQPGLCSDEVGGGRKGVVQMLK